MSLRVRIAEEVKNESLGSCRTPTVCPKSVHNRRVIEDFSGVFVLSRCFLDFSVGVGLLS